ncbi:MAG: hypothetical protein HFJ94_04975 [Muribaculaceae bacterium]|nr:hypothetical protein [Muribaculaceae bacterium]
MRSFGILTPFITEASSSSQQHISPIFLPDTGFSAIQKENTLSITPFIWAGIDKCRH